MDGFDPEAVKGGQLKLRCVKIFSDIFISMTKHFPGVCQMMRTEVSNNQPHLTPLDLIEMRRDCEGERKKDCEKCHLSQAMTVRLN
jgi:hypothetical protein